MADAPPTPPPTMSPAPAARAGTAGGAPVGRGGAARPLPPKRDESLRTIFEQVIVAFILAFIFRAFVVEAFVIPTGSMADTLLGAHMRFDCPDCAHHFTVNFPTPQGEMAIPTYATALERRQALDPATGRPLFDRSGRPVVVTEQVPRVFAIRCPNCNYRLPRRNPADPANDATAPRVHYGDRILVHKGLYLFKDPSRWDVVVFKNPSRVDLGLDPDSTEPYQQNYIKRLVGLPGERLMLLDGDVYVSRANKMLAELEPDDFVIARKSDTAQSALWRSVYNDDFRPRGLPRDYVSPYGPDRPFANPWQPLAGEAGAGWSIVAQGEGGGFLFDNLEGRGTLAFVPDHIAETLPLTDHLAYNQGFNDQVAEGLLDGRGVSMRPAADTYDRDFAQAFADTAEDEYHRFRINNVQDLRLTFFYERQAGDGPLEARLSKRDDVWVAQISRDRIRLLRETDGQQRLVAETTAVPNFSRARRVDFTNADYRVRLSVDGRTLLETTDADYAPDIATLVAEAEADIRPARPEISLAARGQRARLTHISLWHDVYYTARDNRHRPLRWGSPTSFPAGTIALGEGEFFVLGDNPFLSADARTWDDRLVLRYENLDIDGGRVPERFMLGKAFFVYWPAHFPLFDRVPVPVPNFGDMRFIR